MIGNQRNKKDWWYPPRTENPYTDWLYSKKLGVMLCFGMTTYTASDTYGINRLNVPPNRLTFNPPGELITKCQQWITDINNANDIDYIVIVTKHHIGYKLWDSQIELGLGFSQSIDDPNLGTINLPQVSNYHYSDYDIVGEMTNTAKSLGLPVFLYYNIGRNVNYRGSGDFGDPLYYRNIVYLELKELIQKYRPFGLWLDAPGQSPWNNPNEFGEFHVLFTQLKNVDKNIHITSNISWHKESSPYADSGNLRSWPTDTYSLESTFDEWDFWQYTPKRIHQDDVYYINMEAIIPNNSEEYYFGAPDRSPTWFNTTQMQNFYNHAKERGVPLVVNMSPSQAGILDSTQLNLIGNINL